MRKPQSLRTKFIRALLLVVGSSGLATLGILVVTSVQASSESLNRVRMYIEQGITSKGKVLTASHAQALRELTLDNAFLDMQRLVERVVQQDSDLVYGLYVNSARETLAFSRREVRTGDEAHPAKDAWRQIEISPQELIVTRETIKRTSRFGEDVLEVAMPVSGDDGEVLGTIRYGLSTRAMQKAIEDAKAEARARLIRSVAGVATFAILSALIGWWLSRTAAVRITRPVAELTVAAQALATGNRSVRVKITSGDEIELLGASFNHMVEDLDRSYRELENANRSLEGKVRDRTLELGRKNRDMQLVLDNVEQGFTTLDMEGTMSAERSRVIEDWFGPITGAITFWECLGRVDGAVAEWFELGWAALRDDILPMSLCLEQLPALVRKERTTLELAYRPIMEGERIDKVIVVITDVTVRLERERAEQAQRELLSVFRRLLSDQTALDQFFFDTDTLVCEVLASQGSDLAVLKRQVHTIKGNCALFGLESVAIFCHQMEDRISQSGESMSVDEIETLRTVWSAAKHMRALLSEGGYDGSDGRIELGHDEHAKFVGSLRRQIAHDVLVDMALSWRFEPATKRLQLLGEQIRNLAGRLGRAPVDVVCTPTTLRLPPRKWGPFWTVFAHVVRNTVDHGIDTSDERLRLGAPVNAKVVLGVGREAEHVVVTIADDGRGIDWAKIAESARDRGLPHASRADLEQALFEEGVSSRADITSTSGRGVGLAAVRNVVRNLGGHIEIRTDTGRGTAFRFVLPASMLVDETASNDPAHPEIQAFNFGGSTGTGTAA